MGYDRTVTAALAETQSKFALAEALALDIPYKRGPDADISVRLAEARRAIIDGGGEPRNVETLANYRRTALWVILPTSPEFRWVPDRCFSVHSQARASGKSYAEFAAMPAPTVNAFRDLVGWAGTNGGPETIVRNMPPADQAAAAREALKDPEVAGQAFADPETAQRAYQASREAIGRQVREQLGIGDPPPPPAKPSKADRRVYVSEVVSEAITILGGLLQLETDPAGQRLEVLVDCRDAVTEYDMKRLLRSLTALTARADNWEDQLRGIAGRTMPAAGTHG